MFRMRPLFGFGRCERYLQKIRKKCPSNQREVTLSQCRQFTGDRIELPRLSKQQVTSHLRTFEASFEVNDGAIKSFDSNKLPANNPTEDRSGEVKLRIPNVSGNQYMFGIFDGHAGCACAQLISERLFSYIAVLLSPHNVLERICDGTLDPCDDLVYRFPHWHHYHSTDMIALYRRSLQKLASDLLAVPNASLIEDMLKAAFLQLDEDILKDATPGAIGSPLNIEMLSLALSGSCACVAFIDETDLYVANAGDCQAVLGVQTEDDQWMAVELSRNHSADNEQEVYRLNNLHPNESAQILRGGRLLGDLAPLRAFGDARYKWPEKLMRTILKTVKPHVISVYGKHLIPNNYRTPPYLTAEPEITHHALKPRDKFLILASDGLWEHIEPQQVVNLVAGHMDGKQVLLTDFQLPRNDMSMNEINEFLIVRKRKLAKKPTDENVSSHLLRMALGPKHGKVSQYLTLPEEIVRQYRDDISITVVYFDSEYIANKAFTEQ